MSNLVQAPTRRFSASFGMFFLIQAKDLDTLKLGFVINKFKQYSKGRDLFSRGTAQIKYREVLLSQKDKDHRSNRINMLKNEDYIGCRCQGIRRQRPGVWQRIGFAPGEQAPHTPSTATSPAHDRRSRICDNIVKHRNNLHFRLWESTIFVIFLYFVYSKSTFETNFSSFMDAYHHHHITKIFILKRIISLRRNCSRFRNSIWTIFSRWLSTHQCFLYIDQLVSVYYIALISLLHWRGNDCHQRDLEPRICARQNNFIYRLELSK